MSVALSGIGTLLKLGDGASPENFTTIAKVKDIAGPVLQADVVDVTSQDSPNHMEEIIPTLLRVGEITTTIHYVPTDPTHNAATGLIYQWRNRIRSDYQLFWPDAGPTEWTFTGYVTKFTPKAPVAGALTADLTIRVTGTNLVLA